MTTISDNQVIAASGGLVELAYVPVTTNVTVSATAAGSGSGLAASNAALSATFVSDGSPLLVEYYCPDAYGTNETDYVVVDFYLDSTYYGYLCGNQAPTNGGATIYGARRITPSAGSHTVEVKGWRGGANITMQANTGTTGGSNVYGPAFLRVSKIVQATQWPAIVTGVVTCTSTTRPSSPITGQQILETDTYQQYYWDGSAWRGITVLNYNAQTGTTYTFAMVDGSGQMVTLSNASAITATIPLNSSVPFATGTVLNFMQLGAGQVTIAGAVGVTVNTHSAKTKTAGQYATGSAMKTATDTWVLFGNLA